MRLKEFIKDLYDHGCPLESKQVQNRYQDLDITGIAYDSRDVKPGYIFVAHCGILTDSHIYIEDTKSKGAIFFVLEKNIPIPYPKIIVKDGRKALAVLAQRFYDNPSKKLKVIGVTGTYGKTTSTWLLKSIYEAAGFNVGLIGTIGYWTGSEYKPALHTTPESLDLQRLFFELLNKGINVAVLEVSSHSLSLYRVYGTDFDIACFTRFDRDHLDFHHTLSEYENAKLKLFSNLKSDGIAVLNRDDQTFDNFSSHTRASIITYGITPASDVTGKLCSSTLRGLEVDVRWDNREEHIFSPLIGSHNLSNILLAVSCALKDGINFDTIYAGIKNLKQVPGRFELVGEPALPSGRFAERCAYVIVDYAHTPGSLESAIRSARELTSGRLMCIFGCGGDRDSGKRPLMGKIATELADYTILTSDNPRSEDPMLIARDIEKGITGGNYEIILDRREAIRKGIERASPEDLILLVGKGHEDYQIYGELKIPWDDRKVAMEILSLR
ncbi:MAG: UDP-N-acetylmuramoyl-L-alanyl-D-glutamate--2,6-diaminopimelate ligase [bacterium]|nr:UDP-N-acetylmuramoyl-L-alanyl-D-glutamate--2,6-diaminopimelate ligase [bacterium]